KLFVYEAVSAGAIGEHVSDSLRTEGWAMLTALVVDFLAIDHLEIHTLLLEASPEPLGHVQRHTSASFESQAFLESVSQCNAVLVIAPECGGLLEERSRQVIAANKMLLSSSPEGIALAADKKALSDHWKANGVNTPNLVDWDSAKLPAVCKPRHGAGSQGVV